MFKGGGTSIQKLRPIDNDSYNGVMQPKQPKQPKQQNTVMQSSGENYDVNYDDENYVNYELLQQYHQKMLQQQKIVYFKILENASWKESIIVMVIVLLTTNNISHGFQDKFIPEILKSGNYMHIIISAVLSGIIFFIISNFFLLKK